ncbi:MAG: DUF4240 domain-containing protein [Myxococcota bacterium]
MSTVGDIGGYIFSEIINSDEPIAIASANAFERVVHLHAESGDLSTVVEYAVDDCDGTSGDVHLRILSAELEKLGDVRGLHRLWKGIVANRKEHYGRLKARRKALALDATMWAFGKYSEALRRMGHPDAAAKVEEDAAAFASGKKPRRVKTTDKRIVDEDVFWDLIECSVEEDVSRGSAQHMLALQASLEKLGLRQIKRFDDILRTKLDQAFSWALWGAATVARHGCGDDGFLYFRGWLVAQGRTAFNRVVENPDALADVLEGQGLQCESLLHVSDLAYEAKKGRPMPLGRPLQVDSPLGTPWEEHELPQLFPRLSALTESHRES